MDEAARGGERVAGPPSFRIEAGVLQRLLDASRQRDAVHLAVLEGKIRGGDAGRVVVISGFARFGFTAKLETIYRPMRRSLDERITEGEPSGGQSEVVGMFVSHAGSEGELAPEVARLHLSLYNRPDAVALIADPETGAFGLYVRDEAGRFRNAPFEIDEAFDAERSEDAT